MVKGHKTRHTENLHRLARIEGQVRGIQRMIEEGDYCIDIITQVQACQKALLAVSQRILQKHLETCVTESLKSRSRKDMDRKMEEILAVVKRMAT